MKENESDTAYFLQQIPFNIKEKKTETYTHGTKYNVLKGLRNSALIKTFFIEKIL